MLSISENFSSKGQRPNCHMTKYGQSYSFGSLTAFSVPGGMFCQWKKLTGTVLSISEKLRVKSEGHQMPMWLDWSFTDTGLYLCNVLQASGIPHENVTNSFVPREIARVVYRILYWQYSTIWLLSTITSLSDYVWILDFFLYILFIFQRGKYWQFYKVL